ncbi:MAG TPA: BatA domain-containing protein [Lacipirellulaceae bacterium]|jgi:hypothetical protein|nr:BatA domain-containing protein [Lacipirellulaceae bacterium]
MGFVTPALIGGAALVALPIVLHLIMRRETKRLTFPALRFVQQRRLMNQHRLRLRQLLLLAMRCAIIVLLALALARPTLRGSASAGKEGVAVATALVFDNSLRMQYEQESQTRWQKAKELATWVVKQLPADAPVTVVDRGGRQRGQDLNRDGAEMRIERLEPSAAVRPMDDTLRDATRWLATKKDFRGEVYVFTDLSTEAWSQTTAAEFAKSLDALPGANVYLVDVGVLDPQERALGPLKLSSERVATTGKLHLSTELIRTGAPNKEPETTVELYLGDRTNELEKRGQEVVPNSAQTAPVEFSLSGLEPGPHQGVVRIMGSDPLSSDDARYFTVDVRAPSKVLLLGEKADDTIFLREALAPSVAAGMGQSEFACDVKTYRDIGQLRLSNYAAVFLVNPPPLAKSAWDALAEYAEGGGGVGISLGRNARREEMSGGDAQRLLPAKLRWQSHDTTYLRPVAVEHPALRDLATVTDSAPWSEFPVFKYWELEPGAEPAEVISTFANGKPAIVERRIGSGHVVMITTSFSDYASADAWNLLPTAPDPWPFIALANGIARYLTGGSQTQLNYAAGQTVVMPLTPDEQVSSYVLQLPDASAMRQTLAAGQHDLSITSTEELGNYRVRAGGEQEKLDRGFSVNLPIEITQLQRVPVPELVKSLGSERTRTARTREEIEVRVGVGRVGHELFPALILAVALVLAAEQLLANRFYESVGTVGRPEPKPAVNVVGGAPSTSP